MNDVNREVIREFRANRGEVGGAFEGVQFADSQERTARRWNRGLTFTLASRFTVDPDQGRRHADR
ncbi:hypothetical protein ACWEV3_39900 [Saccharopolyspora sp. NPDC003752]